MLDKRLSFPVLLGLGCLLGLAPAARAECTFTVKTSQNGVRLFFANDDNARVEFYGPNDGQSPQAWLSRSNTSNGGSSVLLGAQNTTYRVLVKGYALFASAKLKAVWVQPGGYEQGEDMLLIESPGGLGDKAKVQVVHVRAPRFLQVVDGNTVTVAAIGKPNK